jgi:hypothetical protein
MLTNLKLCGKEKARNGEGKNIGGEDNTMG